MQNQKIYKFDQDHTDQKISLGDVLFLGLRNWYWFVFSISICVALAFFYTKSLPQTYQVQALIMIKTDNHKGGGLSEFEIFADMGLGRSVSVVENQIPVIRSTSLMDSVVNKLGLDVTYTVKPLIRTVDIYGRSPINVVFENRDLMRGFVVNITPLSATNFKYGVIGSDNAMSWKEAKYGDIISTINGKFVVGTTPQFTPRAIDENILVSVYDVRTMAKSILKNLDVERTDKVTDILSLTLDDNNFQRAVDVINTLIEVYNQEVIADKNSVARNTEKFIVEQIIAISTDLGGIDGQIEQFQKDNSLIDFTSASNILLQTDSKYKEQAVAVETEIALVQFIRDYLSDPSKQNELIPINTGVSDAGIESQIEKYNEVRLQLNKLLVSTGENNPVTIDLINDLNSIKVNMIHSIDNLLSSLKIRQSKNFAQRSLSDRSIASVPTQQKQINDVIRQQKIKEELYLYLLNKRSENALKLAITESNAKIIERADGNKRPVSPIMVNYILLALLIGFAIPVIVIVMARWIVSLDVKVRNKRDVEAVTSIPIVGELPGKHKSQRDLEVLICESGRDRISEAFRIVRSNMDFIVKKESGRARIIQTTSTMPGEGKTYISVNLALSYAHTGKKVLLVDLDLRKGQLSRITNLNVKYGMSSYLSGRVDQTDLIVNKGVLHPALDVITTGAIPPNPANLLMSDRLDKLMSQLSETYDYIFIDTVPFGIVADALLVNRVVDITLYVVRVGKIDKRQLPELEKIYKEQKARNLTIILTDVNVDSKRYGYGYGYKYGYGSSYVDGE